MLLGAGNVDAAGVRHLARSPQLPLALAALDGEFDHIVFDLPPILGGSDALAMVRHADAYLMVVQHGSTPVEQVRAAAEELRAVPSLGVVINQYSTRIPKVLRRFFTP
jgi:Mrp family chromosome partitioning ATPase